MGRSLGQLPLLAVRSEAERTVDGTLARTSNEEFG